MVVVSAARDEARPPFDPDAVVDGASHDDPASAAERRSDDGEACEALTFVSSAVPPSTAGLLDRSHRSLTLGAVALVALIAFEALAVTTAMPTVAQALNGLSLYALAFGGTLAASVIGMVATGSWADRRGPVPPLRQGIVWFAAGLALAGLAPSMGVLLLGRVVQGFGAGLISVSLYVVVGRAYSPSLRPKMFAAFSAAWVVPAIVGPMVSGAIVEHIGWRWVFLSVPIVAAWAAWMVLPALRGLGPVCATDAPSATPASHRLYWAAGTTASLLLLHYGGQQRHTGIAAILLAAAIAGLIVSVARLLPAGTLRAARGLPTVVALRGLIAGAFFLTEAYLPLLLSRERGVSATAAGLVVTMGALGWSAGGWYRGHRNAPPVHFLRVGIVLLAVGVASVGATVVGSPPLAATVLGWIVGGFGIGLAYPTLSVLTLELSAPEQQGVNASALQLSDAAFTAASLGVGGSLFAALLNHSHNAAYLSSFGIALALALLGAGLSGRVRSRTGG